MREAEIGYGNARGIRMKRPPQGPLSDEDKANRRRRTGAEQRRKGRRNFLIGRRDRQPDDWPCCQRRWFRCQPGIGRGLTGSGAERIVWSSFVGTMVRVAVGKIDVAQRAARRHYRQRCIDQGYESGTSTVLRDIAERNHHSLHDVTAYTRQRITCLPTSAHGCYST